MQVTLRLGDVIIPMKPIGSVQYAELESISLSTINKEGELIPMTILLSSRFAYWAIPLMCFILN